MKQTFAIFLASLIFFSNVGIAIGNHYCGGDLESSAITFANGTLSCEMEEESTICDDSTSENSIEKKECCENEYQQINLEDYNKSVKLTESTDLKLVATFLTTCVDLFSFEENNTIEFSDYSPPILGHDVQVMHQVFLI